MLINRALASLLAGVLTLGLLAGCEQLSGGSNVEGYQELEQTLPADELAAKNVFDAAAAYEPVQIALEQAVNNPDVPADIKDRIKQADRETVAALKAYRASVQATGTPDQARMQAVLMALQRAQALVGEVAQTEGDN